ncbi:carbonic anhydrase [Suillus occidentalis]|nr:carbonic anhydrase [Suillus occidentalis]
MEQPNVTNVTDVIDKLLKANVTWATGVGSDFFQKLLVLQEPKVLWIGCSDSRVPASVVTSSLPGDIFTHTNIANQFHSSDDNCLLLVLVGHTGCGGVKEAITTANKEEHVELDTPLTRWLKPLVKLGLSEKDAVDKVVEANIINKVVKENIIKQVENIWNSEPISTAQKTENKVSVHGWMYNLSNGLITKVHE